MVFIKKRCSVLLTLILFLSFLVPATGQAVSNTYVYHDCTWTAWQYAYDHLGIALPKWGYADDWYDFAQRDGYPTGQIPAVNAIMVWRGHVGFITQVSADGQSVYIVEGGWGDGDNWLHKGWKAAGGPSSSGKAFLGYIYLDGIPSNTSRNEPEPSATESDSSGSSDTTVDEAASNQQEANNTTAVQSSESSELGDIVNENDNAQRELELTLLRAKKENLTTQISETEQEISDLTAQLHQTNLENEERIRAMYMLGNESYLEILFSSESVSDFFVKAEQISNIIAMDRQTIKNMETLTEEIDEKKSELEQALAELNEIDI